jgi:hypothetical protein
MTLKKGSPFPLQRPSNMRRVLEAVQNGNQYRREVMKVTGLNEGQVRSALHNLVFIGFLERRSDTEGRSTYQSPGQWRSGISEHLIGVSSIFHPRFTNVDNK